MPLTSPRAPRTWPLAGRTRPAALERLGPLVVALVVLAALAQVLSSCGGGSPSDAEIDDAAGAVPQRVYWAGRSFAGMPLASLQRDGGYVTFIYGDCTPERDSGCAPPLTIQTVSICELNPLNFEEIPARSVRLSAWRHILVREYVRGRRMVNIGASTIILDGRASLTKQALTALRPVGEPAGTRPLRARYPAKLVTEVRRVRDAYRRQGAIRAVRDELRISKTAIRFRLELARELGSKRLKQRGFLYSLRDIPVFGDVDFESPCKVEPV